MPVEFRTDRAQQTRLSLDCSEHSRPQATHREFHGKPHAARERHVRNAAFPVYFRTCDMAVAIPAQALVLAFRAQLPGQLRSDHRLDHGFSFRGHLLRGNQPQDVAGGCGSFRR